MTFLCIIVQYLSFILVYKYPIFYNPFEIVQISMQAYYLYLYINQFKVKNPYIYLEIGFDRGSYLMFFLHLYCIISFFSGKNILMALASNFTLILQWNEHSIILSKVNEYLIKN